jgi:hypothetical protein
LPLLTCPTENPTCCRTGHRRGGLIDAQPCRIPGAGSPRRALGRTPQVADRLLSPAQVAAVAAAMPPRYRALVLAAAWSGLRQGELLALTRADLDLAAVPAVVRVQRGVRRSDTGTMETGLPKAAASVRTVSLPGPLAEALAAHLAAFVPDQPDAPVFATSRGTVPARSNLNTSFRRALMARLCHATPAAALIYLHARAERDHTLTNALSAAMAPSVNDGEDLSPRESWFDSCPVGLRPAGTMRSLAAARRVQVGGTGERSGDGER